MRKKTLICVFLTSLVFGAEFNAPMQACIDTLKAEAKKQDASFRDFDALRGEKIFSTKNQGKNNELISCQSCHGSNLKESAKNIFTDKTLPPLAPSVNPTRLTDVKEVKKWLKRNFKDVFLREGTPQEKGDVLYYLIKQ